MRRHAAITTVSVFVLLASLLELCACQEVEQPGLLARLYELTSVTPVELAKSLFGAGTEQEPPQQAVPVQVQVPAVPVQAQVDEPVEGEESAFAHYFSYIEELVGISPGQLFLTAACLFFAASLGQHGGDWMARRLHGGLAEGAAADLPAPSTSASDKPKEE